MEATGHFTIAGHLFECFLPSGPTEDQVWTIIVTKDGRQVHFETVPLEHEPRFGVDADDITNRDIAVEMVIKALGLGD